MSDIMEQLRLMTVGCATFVCYAENNPDGGGYCSECGADFEMRMDSLNHVCSEETTV